MSDTTTDITHAPHTAPAPEPPTELTGSLAAIHIALAALTEDVTAAELALTARVGRSTAGKALTTLEQRKLAIRTPGGHDGPRRIPDLWRAAPTPTSDNSDGFAPQQPADAQHELASTKDPEPVGPDINHESAPAETAPATPTAPDNGSTSTTPTTETTQDAPPHGEGTAADDPHTTGGNVGSGADSTPAPPTAAERRTAPPEFIRQADGRKRLAPGSLRQMVIEHLQAHPGEAFTATKISRVIEKSSGAIANALVTLVKQEIAEQVTDRPRTYRLASPADNR